MDLETAIEGAALWQVRADEHYERAAVLNKGPETALQAATETPATPLRPHRPREPPPPGRRAGSGA
ncbi:hypothetical protein [Kitasatospora sp. NPDC088548]|uniref:hypothetical protein n=1 Tax=Kitasatospora sp. NPDC088548 TaxID=3364075 RepID=UPI00380918FF